ncbi:unnamed protein product [Staurois parvus]|uniref:Uncharacterized protein n=1 Tax=Staurois parvus TaxID=386267 RepID=A0ABN9EGL6_9NEOB|nr:unnamed protein product [Staurois parvus]
MISVALSMPHVSAHQSTSMPHISAAFSAACEGCQSVPPVRAASQCRLTVQVSAAYQCHI